MSTSSIIPFLGIKRQNKYISDELLDVTENILRSGIYLDGPNTEKLERWLEVKTCSAYAITVHSGTQALDILAKWQKSRRLGNSIYDDIVVNIPNLTYKATLNSFINAGFIVEILDTDKNGIMERKNKVNFDLACIVGLYGADPGSFPEYSSYNTVVDGAQHWLVATTKGEGMAVSFDPTKNLYSSGNGGAIVTDSHSLFVFANNYKRNECTLVGATNTKMSEIDCAHVSVRSQYIGGWQDRRKEIRNFYLDEFKNLPLRCLSRGIKNHSDHKFVVYYADRDKLRNYLTECNIETKIHYETPLNQLHFSSKFEKPTMISTSVLLSNGVLSLPIHPELTDSEIEYISKKVNKFFENIA